MWRLAAPLLLATLATAYERIQYVGFPVQTGYNGYLREDGLFYPNANGLGEYVGKDSVAEDIRARLDLLAEMIEGAYADPSVDRDPGTLKLFMAPEFCLRGPRGAYDADDDAFLAVGDEFAARVAHAKFADWVFVSGSIIGAVPSAARARPGGVQLYDTFNFVIVQRGANATERVTHFKRYISSIGERARESGETCDDPLRSERETPRTRLPPPPRNPPLASAPARARPRRADFLSAQPNEPSAVVYPNMNLGATLDAPTTMGRVTKQYAALSPSRARAWAARLGANQGNSSFDMAGVRFCLDVCLDHGYGICAAELDAERAAGVSPGLVQAHLVVSAGSSIQPSHVRVPDGGSAVLCDGLASGAQHVIERADDPMRDHTHVADRAREVPGWDGAAAGAGARVLDRDYAGRLPSTRVDVLGDGWKARVNELFAVQKYRGEAVRACALIEDDARRAECYADHETKPVAFVFASAPIVPLEQ